MLHRYFIVSALSRPLNVIYISGLVFIVVLLLPELQDILAKLRHLM